jgi:hypothetical protein
VSFLSIAFLAALPLAAAPLLLHWFDRRRNARIEWGAMQFLLEAASRKTRARKFQHPLLLVLRILAVTALVLTLARPLVPGKWFAVNDARETILVIDNSMSSQQRQADATAFDEILAKAEATIDELDHGSAVRILLASPYPAWVTPTSMRVNLATRPQLAGILHELRPTQGTSDLPATLLKAVHSDLEGQRLAGRRIVLFTDGQRKDWRTDDRASWLRFHAAFDSARVPTTLEVIEARRNRPESANIAIARLQSNCTVVGINQPLSVTAEVHNHSLRLAEICPVTWFINNEKQCDSTLPALQPGETHDVAWHNSFTKPGVYLLTCQIDSHDDLKPDDRESVVVEVVERVPVLLVEGSEGLAEMQQDAYLFRAALGRIEGDESEDLSAVFEPRTVPPHRLESIDLEDFAAIVIPNVTVLSDKAVNRLSQFVANGGGLWLALGPRTDVDAFNKWLFNDGDGLSPVALSRMVDETRGDSTKPAINPFLKSHRATSNLADNDQLDTGEVRVSRRFRFQMPTDDHHVSVLLDLSTGDPLVVENRVGKGRVIVQAVPLRFQWSSLAVSQSFVVMVHDWLGYLTEPRATQHNLLPGDPISLYIAGIQETHATLSTPSGEDIAVSGEPATGGVLFRTSHTSLPGNYSLETGLAGSNRPFHVVRDPGESDLAGLSDKDRAVLGEMAGLDHGRVVNRVSDTNLSAPAWPVLSILLVAFMAGELLLAGVIACKRFGTAPIAETAEQMASQPSVGMSLGRRGARTAQRQSKVHAEVNS